MAKSIATPAVQYISSWDFRLGTVQMKIRPKYISLLAVAPTSSSTPTPPTEWQGCVCIQFLCLHAYRGLMYSYSLSFLWLYHHKYKLRCRMRTRKYLHGIYEIYYTNSSVLIENLSIIKYAIVSTDRVHRKKQQHQQSRMKKKWNQ